MRTAAELRKLLKGRTPVAFGVSGPLAVPLFSLAEVVRLVEAAMEAGVSIFDTGPSYGAGEAERRLGASLRGREDVVLMTKAGVEVAGPFGRRRNFDPHSIVQSVERSLTRLGRQRIDMLWLHGPAREELTDELLRALEQLAADGKVLAVGVASRDPLLADVAARGPFAAFMAPANRRAPLPCLADQSLLFFGVECLADVQRPADTPVTRSALWKKMRGLVRGATPPSPAAPLTVDEAFRFAFEKAECDVVVTTTTRAARILENVETCRRYRTAPR